MAGGSVGSRLIGQPESLVDAAGCVTAGEPTETMTLTGETYVIGERWSGVFESSGWTAVLDDDPACPAARGTR